MSNFATLSVPPYPTSQPLLSPALLTLDKNGLILAANTAALRFWQVTADQLNGTALTRLFQFEGTSVTSAGSEARWALLLANAHNRTVSCPARLPQGIVQVGLRIEELQGGTLGFIAVVDDPASHRDSTPPMLVDSGLALLANEGAVGFFDLNFKAQQIYYSPAWKRLLGYNDTDIANTYESWLRLIHPDDSAAAPDQALRKQKEGVRSFSVEMRMLHRDGHHLWVQCLGTQVVGPGGELERVTGLQIDIGERKELEEQSVLNDERLQRLTTTTGLIALDFDFARGRFWLSSGWKQLLGDPPDGATSELDCFLAALPPATAAGGAEAFFLATSAGQESFVQQLTLRRADERTVPVLFGAHRQLTRKGALARVTGFCCALPGNLSAVTTIPLPAPLVGETLATISEALLVTDGQGRIVYLNPQAERLTGCGLEGSRGALLGDVFRLVERTGSQPDTDALDLALAMGDHPPLCADHALLSAGGGPARPIVWSIRQIWASDGRIEGLVLVFRDPQEMTLTPEELLKINRWESLGVIAGGIAHDFNNLLTTILGGISHAKDNHDSSYLPDSERACLAAKALTKQLLAAAKGGGPETAQALSPGELLREAIRIGRAGTSAEIVLDAPDTVAPVRVNRSQMLQVFQNLIINALQALPADRGKIWLTTSNTRLEENAIPPLAPGNYVEIEVKDNGSGIPAENLEKIFEPFFTTKKMGTGIGLSTVRNIVRKHGGQIRVSSTPGQGTVFSLYLPQADRPPEVETRRAPMITSGTGRVLLMDDDPDIARLSSGMLASLDYKYDVARNGEEAVALYRRYVSIGRPYDLVILDLTVIGGMGGEEAFRQLHEIDKNVRAIVCSGYDSEEMAQHYIDMGFAGYLAKPFRLGDLARAIKAVLN